MIKKIKALILTLWFVLSIILTPILILKFEVLQESIQNLGVISIIISFSLLVNDKELRHMKLW